MRAQTAEALDEVDGLIHDAWFKPYEIVHDAQARTVIIPFVQETDAVDETGRIPFVRGQLTIGAVDSMHMDAEFDEPSQLYGVLHDASAGALTVYGGGGELRAAVDRVDVAAELTDEVAMGVEVRRGWRIMRDTAPPERPMGGTTALVNAAGMYPPGRGAFQRSSAELACGLVNVSDELRSRLQARGVDTAALRWPPDPDGLGRDRDEVLHAAIGLALAEREPWIGVPYVLRALADRPACDGARWFAAAGVDADGLRELARGWSDRAGGDPFGRVAPGTRARTSTELARARTWASDTHPRRLTAVQLLAGLLETSERVRAAFARAGADPAAIVADAPAARRHRLPPLPRRGIRLDEASANSVIAGAANRVFEAGGGEITASDVLRVLAARPGSPAGRLLAQHGIGPAELTAIADELG